MTQEDIDTVVASEDFDELTGVPSSRIPNAPVPAGGLKNWLKQGRNLKFEVNPVDNSGIIYISSRDSDNPNKEAFSQEKNLYEFQVPDSITDESDEYNEYLKNCFKNFEELIQDMTYHGFISSEIDKNKIGVILEEDNAARNRRNAENQTLLNSTISKLISDLSTLIDEKLGNQKTHENPEFKLIQLEETINVLSLVNALFFSTTDEILILLINWVNRADIQPDLDLASELLEVEYPYENTLFWTDYLKKLISRGLFAQAINALQNSKFEKLEEEDNDLYLVIADLMVLLSNYDTVQFSFENRKFISWKQKCCELRDNFKNVSIINNENIIIKNSVYDILLLMTGLHSAAIKSSSSWYECLLAKYLFELPSESFITQYLDTALSHFSLDESESYTWELACVDLIRGNYLKVVRSLEVLDNPTATYLSVLFEARGLFNTYDFLLGEDSSDQENKTISELLLSDHALECLCHQKLIPIGVGILINLNTSATRSVISQYLPKFHCKTNDDLEWCLSVCAKLKLSSTASTILKINGNRLFDQGQLYESLVLFSKSGDLKILADKCWLIFENAVIKSEKISDELINALILSDDEEFEMSDSLRQCLSPYAIFLKFLDHKTQNEFKDAIKYLTSLLNFKYLPKKYVPLLLCQLLPFLKSLPSKTAIEINPSNETIISHDDLIKILESLNDFEEKFISSYKACLRTSRHSIEQQLLINQYEDMQDLYKVAISDDYKSQVKDRANDWRFQIELIEGDSFTFPETIQKLLLYIRERFSLQIAWNFLDDQ